MSWSRVAILAALQIITESSCRSSSTKVDAGEAADKLHHLKYQLLDAKAPKEEIKVQVVPYKDYKSINARQSKPKQSAKKSKNDVPLAIILADPKFNNKVNRQGNFLIKNNKKKDRKKKTGAHDEDSDSNESHKPIIIQVDRNQFIKNNLSNKKYPPKSSKVKQAIGSHTLRSRKINKPQKLSGKRSFVDIEDSSLGSSSSSDMSSSSEDTTHEYEDWKHHGNKISQKRFIPHKSVGNHKAISKTKSYFNPKQHQGIHFRDNDDHEKDSQSSESSDSSDSKENRRHSIKQSNGKHHRSVSESQESYSVEDHNIIGHNSQIKDNIASKIHNVKREHLVTHDIHHKNKQSSSNEEQSHFSEYKIDEARRKIHSESVESNSHETKGNNHSINPENLHHTLKRHNSAESPDKHHEKHGVSENHNEIKSNDPVEGFGLEKSSSESKESTNTESADDDHSTEVKIEEKLHKSSESKEKLKTVSENHNEYYKHIDTHKHGSNESVEVKQRSDNEHDKTHKTHNSSEEIFKKVRVSTEESTESNSEEKLHPENQSLDSQVALRSGSVEHNNDAKTHDKEHSDNSTSSSNSKERAVSDQIDSKENHKSVLNKTETVKAGSDISESLSQEIHKESMILPHVGEWDTSEDITSETSHANGYVIVDEKNLYNKQGDHKQEDHKQEEYKQTNHIELSKKSASDEFVDVHHEGELEKGDHNNYEIVNEDVPYELITAHSGGGLNSHDKFESSEIIEVLIIPGDTNIKPVAESHHYIKHHKETDHHDQDILSHNKIDGHDHHEKDSVSTEIVEDDSSSTVEIIHRLGSHDHDVDIDHKSSRHNEIKHSEKSSRSKADTHNNNIKKNDNKFLHIPEENSSEELKHKRHISKDYKKKNKYSQTKYVQSKKGLSSESSEELKSIEKHVLDSISNYAKKKPAQVDHHATKSYNLSFLFNRR